MKTLVQAAVLTLLSTGVWSTAASAVDIFTQEPCFTEGKNGHCVGMSISPKTNFPQSLQSVSFSVAKSGKAEVSFHGSMVCSSERGVPAVVDLITQIVTSQSAEPVITGPGGARHAIVLLPTESGTTDSFNLAATRTFTFIPPGQSVISFNVTSLRMDPATSCVFYNMTFSVVYMEG